MRFGIVERNAIHGNAHTVGIGTPNSKAGIPNAGTRFGSSDKRRRQRQQKRNILSGIAAGNLSGSQCGIRYSRFFVGTNGSNGYFFQLHMH